MLALIGNLDSMELVIVLLAAVLVFGKNLPQVARQAARQIVKLRRQLDEAWRETGMEQELRKVQSDIQSAIPRDLSIGEMARLASLEMDRRVREVEAEARAPAPAPARPGEALPGANGSAPANPAGERAPPPGATAPADAEPKAPSA